ncbi:Uncharacterized protein TPAR_01482 [Tolypocladium paradoxum]|uniref:Alcohol acetyltransferase FCK4 n=1 Tax=Tolypocladium paradoxum TaxID=94208 RepID=A0A2S4L7C7_9HYPO|nr:Uncharacterized protein TPAR_01482 [Tolypocladium paradoxum]
MAAPNQFLRRANLGFYHAIVISAVYEFTKGFNTNDAQSFFKPLRRCIEEHPFLSVVVGDKHTDKAYFERVPTISLKDHITILSSLSAAHDASAEIEKVLGGDLDQPFPEGIPPWRIIVLPLQSSQALIVFSFSHSIGDGPTGTSFHRSFLKAVRTTPKAALESASSSITTPELPLPAPFDTPERLPISWSFLLGPLLGDILPRFLANLLGLKAQASTVDKGTWLGTRLMFFHPDGPRSRLKLREIPAPVVANAVRVSRTHDAKLTGVLQQIIVRALSKAIDDASVTNFVSETAVNMRKSVGVHEDEMGEFASGCYLPYVRPAATDAPLSEEEWEAARVATRKLAMTASTLQDQPIGLLRYAPSVRKWMAAKIGQERGSSFEMSNVGVFDVGRDGDAVWSARVVKAIFAQPGHVASSPIAFNIVTTKGRSMVYTATWPLGALGVPEEQEDAFMTRVCDSIDADVAAL